MPENVRRRTAAGLHGQPVALVARWPRSDTRRPREWSVTEDEPHSRCRPSAELPVPGDAGVQLAELVKHLAVALSLHVRNLRQAGVAVPAEVEDLAGFLTRSARTRPQATPVDEDSDAAHSPRVPDRLLVTKGEAAERLGVSVRTVERLVAAGRLPLVHVERAARLRVSDLEAYVHHLPEQQTPQSGAGDPP